MTELATKHCKACEGESAKLEDGQICGMIVVKVKGWEVHDGVLVRTFRFKNYHETMALVNGTAWISHRENHHPWVRFSKSDITRW